jgi:hypothetical protein
MLKLSVRRQPLSDHSYFAERSFEATLSVRRLGDPPDDQTWLELGFVTNPNGKKVSLFQCGINPWHFAKVARMMVEADPTAAIHAFGELRCRPQRSSVPGSKR